MELDYAYHYRKWHPDTDEHYEASSSHEASDIQRYLPESHHAAIFELGAGMGLCLFALRKLDYDNLSGIDADRSQVEAARSRQLPVELVPVSETLAWLRGRGARFDFAYAIDVLEHIPHDQIVAVLQAIAESLRPGATFVCRVPNCNAIVGMRQRYIDWTHETSFSPESLDFVLHAGGFQKISVTEARDPPLRGVGGLLRGAFRVVFRSIRRLQYFAEATGGERTLPLSSNLVAVCCK